jgi:hypothetical protein
MEILRQSIIALTPARAFGMDESNDNATDRLGRWSEGSPCEQPVTEYDKTHDDARTTAAKNIPHQERGNDGTKRST